MGTRRRRETLWRGGLSPSLCVDMLINYTLYIFSYYIRTVNIVTLVTLLSQKTFCCCCCRSFPFLTFLSCVGFFFSIMFTNSMSFEIIDSKGQTQGLIEKFYPTYRLKHIDLHWSWSYERLPPGRPLTSSESTAAAAGQDWLELLYGNLLFIFITFWLKCWFLRWNI